MTPRSRVIDSTTERCPPFKILIQRLGKYALKALLVSYLEMNAVGQEQVPTNINEMVKGFATM